MRKSVFILLTVFTACLLCKESENMPGTSRKFMDETFLNRGEENLLARQWQCEYIYSDLSFTSVLPEAKKTRSTVSMFRHGAHGRLRATVLSMCCVTYGISGVAGSRRQGISRKRFRGRLTCRRLLRLSPAPAHYLAIWQEDSQRPGKKHGMSGKRESCMSCFRGNENARLSHARNSFFIRVAPMHIR